LHRTLDERLGRLAARWVAFVLARGAAWIAAIGLATAALGAFAWHGLAVDSNEDALFADSVGFVALRKQWNGLFPQFIDPVVVVIDAATDDEAHAAARALARRLAEEPEQIARLAQPGSGPFFEREGLLYLDTEELEELADRLAAAQPYLAQLSRDPSARALLDLLAEAIDAARDESLPAQGLDDAIGRVRDVVAAHAAGNPVPLSWSRWILGESAPHAHRRFLLVEPRFDFGRIDPAGPAIATLREAIAELGLGSAAGGSATARLTGVYAFSQDEAEVVERQAIWAGLASFALVALVLVPGLGSLRATLVALATLATTLVWTAGFAALAVGHLNPVSVAFAVLVIGLGIDFGIHVCVRVLELRAERLSAEASLRAAALDVGGSLGVCSATTAFAFFAFVPTEYHGVGELGLIAGTSMGFALFLSLTLLPALLARFGPATVRPHRTHALLARLEEIPVRRPRLVLALTSAVAVLAAGSLPRVHFDENPLRVRDPSTESVQVFDDLLETGEAFPWNMNALATDAGAAARLGEQLAALPDVDHTVTLAGFVPQQQEAKLAILADLRFLLDPSLGDAPREPSDPTATRAALEGLRTTLATTPRESLPPELAASAAGLGAAVDAFLRAYPPEHPDSAQRLTRLDQALTGYLPEQLRLLREALSAGPVTLESLPPELRDRWVATDGRVRVEIFPAQHLGDTDRLAAYVANVQALAPGAYGEGLVIVESGRVVVRALRQALLVAGIGIAALLLLLWRDPRDASLALLPIALAALLTAGGMVWLGIPLNFANVIVIPLLLGMGVDSGIHLVHRLRSADSPGGNLLRSGTARAVLLSALTTLASFGTLAASSHPGLASLGQLLALGLGSVLLANLVVLPAAAVLLRQEQSRENVAQPDPAVSPRASDGRA